MSDPFDEFQRQELRRELVDLIHASNPELDGLLTEETSLIRSGKLDSLGLFNLATFIERKIGKQVDFTSFDLSREWDSISNILEFMSKLRAGH